MFRRFRYILSASVILILLFSVIYLGFREIKESRACSKFGDDVFQAQNKSCYKCPNGLSPILEENTEDGEDNYEYPYSSTNQYKIDEIGTPLCRSVKESSMNSLGKTTASAIEAASGFQPAQNFGSIYTNANVLDYYTKPAVRIGKEFTKEDYCRKKYPGSIYDPETETCKKCPTNFTQNPPFITSKNYGNPQACYKTTLLGLGETEYNSMESYPVELNTETTVLTTPASESGSNLDMYSRFKCPKGYSRNPDMALTSNQVCYKSCPKDTLPDSAGTCYKCPSSYQRTSADITSKQACKISCKSGVEYNGECYKCPDGYERTKLPISEDQACVVKCPEKSLRVNYKCYQCPDGYNINRNAITSNEICYKNCPDGSYEDVSQQTCFKCPEGYDKNTDNISPNNPNACLKTEIKPANLISLADNGKLLYPKETRKLIDSAKKKIENIL